MTEKKRTPRVRVPFSPGDLRKLGYAGFDKQQTKIISLELTRRDLDRAVGRLDTFGMPAVFEEDGDASEFAVNLIRNHEILSKRNAELVKEKNALEQHASKMERERDREAKGAQEAARMLAKADQEIQRLQKTTTADDSLLTAAEARASDWQHKYNNLNTTYTQLVTRYSGGVGRLTRMRRRGVRNLKLNLLQRLVSWLFRI